MKMRGVSYFASASGIKEQRFNQHSSPPFFLLCDQLCIQTSITQNLLSARQIVEEFLTQSLKDKNIEDLTEASVAHYLMHCHNELQRLFPQDPPLLSLALGIYCELVDKTPILLFAAMGDVQLIGIKGGVCYTLFSDPYCGLMAENLSLQERKSSGRNYLGQNGHVHISCQKLELQPHRHYLALSYGMANNLSKLESLCKDSPVSLREKQIELFLRQHRLSEHELHAVSFSIDLSEEVKENPQNFPPHKRGAKMAPVALAVATCCLIALSGYHFVQQGDGGKAVAEKTWQQQEREIASLKESYQQQSAMLNFYKETIHGLETQLAEIEKPVIDSYEKIALKEALTETKQHMENLLAAKHLLEEKYASLEKEKEEIAKMADRDFLQQQKLQAANTAEALQQEVASLRLHIAQTLDEKQDLERKNQELSHRCLSLKEALEVNSRTLDAVQKQQEAIEKEHQLLIASHQGLQTKNQELSQNEIRYQEREKSAKKEMELVLRELKSQLKEQMAALTSLKKSRDALMEELQMIKSHQKLLQQKEDSAPSVLSETIHTVTNGDTLSTISLKYYGTSKRWNEIFDANRDTIKEPTQIKVGMQLIIP